jgi:hypothetical protein
MISNVQDEYTFLYISNNPLGELQNNVLAPLKRLSSLTIISSRHKLKYIQSYAFNASNLKSLTLADSNFKFRHQTFILTIHFVSVLGFIHLSYHTTVCHQIPTLQPECLEHFDSYAN